MDPTGRDELRKFLTVGVLVSVLFWGGVFHDAGLLGVLLFVGLPGLVALVIARLRPQTGGGAAAQVTAAALVAVLGPFVLIVVDVLVLW